MEPFRKRQRLYSPVRHEYPRHRDTQHEYYDELAESEEYEEDLEDEEPISDPDADLEQRRAQLDYKLKSTFEAIFEKYGKDFDGIGDELDLETGEWTNNGHLIEMLDERDPGDTRRGREYSTEDTTETEEGFSSSVVDGDIEEDEIDEDDEEDEDSEDAEDASSEDDMMEDDMILRGFSQATQQFMQPEPHIEPSHAHPRLRNDFERPKVSRPSIQPKPLPSRTEILAQFGPQLGPEIIKYVSEQNVSDEPHIEPAWSTPNIPGVASGQRGMNIEPAWRVPEIPAPAVRKRPILKTVILQPEVERSPSPDTAPSLWAPARPRRRKGSGTSPGTSPAIDIMPNRKNAGFYTSCSTIAPVGHRSKTDFGTLQIPRKKKARQIFTLEEDRTMLDWITRAQKHSNKIPISLWENLESRYPHHNVSSWKKHYARKYTYLKHNTVEDSEISTTETSEDALQFLHPRKSRPNDAGEADHTPVGVAQYERPVRVRKPAQRDSHIISWSEAVDTIKSLDPDLHAGMRADARRNLDEGSSAFDHHRSSSNQHVQRRHVSDHRQNPRQSFSGHGDGQLLQQSRRRFSDLPIETLNGESRPLSFASSVGRNNKDISITSAACPHSDCRFYTMKVYELQRRADEDQSQMSSHLLNVHHTSPFPCGEIGCLHKGEHGYFMQADLVRHVKSDHPNIGALHRLRGRVDSHLLEISSELGRPLGVSSNEPNPSGDRPVSQHRDSDFMSPARPPSNGFTSTSRPFSRSSDLNRTLTPRGTTDTSTHTPMTSVSSLMVNHPSAKVNTITGTDGSQERTSETTTNMHNEDPRNENTLNQTSYASAFVDANEEEHQMRWNNPASPEIGSAIRNVPRQFTSASNEQAGVSGRGKDAAPHGRRHPEVVIPSITQNSLPRSRPSVPASIPDSQNSVDGRPSSARQPETSGSSAANATVPSRQFTQENSKDSAFKAKAVSSMLPPNKPQYHAAGPPPTTPAKKRKPEISTSHNVFDRAEADELSLGSDGFVLLSSRRTAKTPFELSVRIKREDTVDTGSGTVARKRKLQDFQAGDDIDELMADEPDFSVSQLGSSSRTTRIKEEDEPVRAPALFKQVRARKQSSRSSKKSSLPRSVYPSVPSPSIRAGTPLLDLTPKQVPEIAESNQGSSSPLPGLLTPLKHRHAEGPAIVVKTPGGTFRRCGEAGFACRKSFCFRCGSNVVGGVQ